MTSCDPSRDTETVVRRYFAVVGDLASTPADLESLLDPRARFVEHPNPIVPAGATRTVEETLAGFAAGKALLREQDFDLHEVLVVGERAAIRGTWRGTVGIDAGRFTAGTELVAEMAGLLTVRDGRVLEHETFDCYHPFGGSSGLR
ncbi:nuclear transport factor 2 family protein [Nocardioides sp. MAHUQ-72]|uniref:nuclear transport factor 2 family protein n=1 Tax=unclassified Nocardioides TaxID=2615069 RepID=UPI003606EEE0